MSNSDVVPLFLVGITALSTAFFAFRTLHYWTDTPDCDVLESVSGRVSESKPSRRFYGAWRLDVTIDEQPLRVVPGPSTRLVARAVHRDPHLTAWFCPRSDGSRPRLWAASQTGDSVVTVEMQRAHAMESARVTLSAMILCALSGLFSWFASKRNAGR